MTFYKKSLRKKVSSARFKEKPTKNSVFFTLQTLYYLFYFCFMLDAKLFTTNKKNLIVFSLEMTEKRNIEMFRRIKKHNHQNMLVCRFFFISLLQQEILFCGSRGNQDTNDLNLYLSRRQFVCLCVAVNSFPNFLKLGKLLFGQATSLDASSSSSSNSMLATIKSIFYVLFLWINCNPKTKLCTFYTSKKE
ncbi:hypothetical protein RFI_26087 [Reticulomyxa filosa]|uniref:Transmembrane protein n=1 Tax=Reticulomyxa filosa TaxID=46433 RepID=X6MBN9_RETFI|nr:hypothetical protein RFI_26087 [Reticulomyxa filosa]|eukprot:ETO11289.1 hypothetical protein RFI_26087 [Reticulomyxa filosa]